MTEQRRRAAAHAEPDQLSRQRAEVDVGAVARPIQRGRFGEVPPVGHQRQPAGELVGVLDQFDAGEQRVGRQRLLPAPQILDGPRPAHETRVRDRGHEAPIGQHAVLHGIRPELAGHLELLVDAHRFGDVDGAVGALRGVVELAQRRMPGAGVVPRAAALGGDRVQALDEGHRPIRLQPPQQHAQCGAHDARAHQHDVRAGGPG